MSNQIEDLIKKVENIEIAINDRMKILKEYEKKCENLGDEFTSKKRKLDTIHTNLKLFLKLNFPSIKTEMESFNEINKNFKETDKIFSEIDKFIEDN